MTPQIVEKQVDELKLLQSVAETIQIVLLQRIEAEIKKTSGQQVNPEDFLADDDFDLD